MARESILAANSWRGERGLLASMGSLDWERCAYCVWWVEWPYLDDDGCALCPWCFDFLVDDGGVPTSTAHWWSNYQNTLRYLSLGRILPEPIARDLGVVQIIADFVHVGW